MQWLRFVAIVVVATILQAGIVNDFAISSVNIKPDLLLILLVFFAVYANTTEAIITAFAIGFAADLIGPAMGPRMISFGIFGTALAYMHRFIAVRAMFYQAFAIFTVGLSAALLSYLLDLMTTANNLTSISAAIFWGPLYSAVIGPFLFLPSAWWMRIKTNRFRQN